MGIVITTHPDSGTLYENFGPQNVSIADDCTFGVTLHDPGGSIITVADITPGTYGIDRIRGGVRTNLATGIASLELPGNVYFTYNFPVADWQVGDLFLITYTGILVTISGVTTNYPDIYYWGRIVIDSAIAANLLLLMADVGDASTAILGSIFGILGDPAVDLSTIIGYEGAVSLADKLTLLRAGYLDNINNAQILNLPDLSTLTAARIGYLDELAAGNIPNDLAVIIAYVDTLEAVVGTMADAATADDLSDIATTSLSAKIRRILLRMSSDAFTATIQGAARVELDTMIAQLATYFVAAGAAFSQTINPGSAARTAIDACLKDLSDILAGGGITTYPASAVPGNGVSLAQVARKIYDLIVLLPTSTFAATSEVSGSLNKADDLLEQTVFTFSPGGLRTEILGIWLDLTTLTQSATIKTKFKIDAANYRTFDTLEWSTTLDDGIYITGFNVNHDVQISIQSLVLEGAIRAIPYLYIYRILE